MRFFFFLPALACLSAGSGCRERSREVDERSLDLSGAWEVQLDPKDFGVDLEWMRKPFGEVVSLPGTLDEGGVGKRHWLKPALTPEALMAPRRERSFVGPVWYRREFEVSKRWAGRRAVLELERVLWQSRVWVDGQERAAPQDSLSVPHRFSLGELAAGTHTLALRIDNAEQFPGISEALPEFSHPREAQPAAHGYTNQSQVLWSGVLGEMALRPRAPVRVEAVSIFPEMASQELRLEMTLANDSGGPAEGRLELTLASEKEGGGRSVRRKIFAFQMAGEREEITRTWAVEATLEPWSLESPRLYSLEVGVERSPNSAWRGQFGFREFAREGSALLLNGAPVFLRGDTDSAVFPRRGRPPMEKAAWRERLQRVRDYGLNHVRFHSWCPPRAAFEAADELGLLLQIELPHQSKRFGELGSSFDWLNREARRILREYGNHPSFAIFSLGAEVEGDEESLEYFVRALQREDDRRLYLGSSGGPATAADDLVLLPGLSLRPGPAGRPVDFREDFREALLGQSLPVVGHALGGWASFPNLEEIGRYDGILRPLPLESIRADLQEKGLLSQAEAFYQASSRFASRLYKEEVERALRTPGLDGFQLFQLRDYPGRGTQTVGLWDAFGTPKPGVSPAAFRQFAGSVVPLARFEKAVWTGGETLAVDFALFNGGPSLREASVAWRLRRAAGQLLETGFAKPREVPSGGVTEMGSLELPLVGLVRADRLVLDVEVSGKWRNAWSLWVYPEERALPKTDWLLLSDWKEAGEALAEGRKVFFEPPLEEIAGPPGGFWPVQGSPVLRPEEAGFLGVWCDPEHPALRDFPTEAQADWQWQRILEQACPVILDGLEVEPLVQVIDHFARNHRLALAFEARVGEGQLLFVSARLEGGPAARQLRRSFLRYAGSEAFRPKAELTPEAFQLLRRLDL
ncbi:MAG: sugar-binding domain-containing protein [Verrucomicrobiota bacterium]